MFIFFLAGIHNHRDVSKRVKIEKNVRKKKWNECKSYLLSHKF